MDSDENPSQGPAPDPENIPDEVIANNLTFALIVFEGLLGAAAIVGRHWAGMDWHGPFQFDPQALAIGAAAGILMLVVNGLLLLPGGDANPLFRWVYRPFHRRFLNHFETLSLEDITFVSLISGLCEELLFRAWIQAQYGIIAGSVTFGVVHIWGRDGLGYGIYATGMGFYLGGVFLLTGGNLWAVALAHGINNFLGLLCIYQGWVPELKEAQEDPQ